MTTDRTFVIVGASLAGAKAAETLREEGFDGRVVLVGSRGRAAVRAAAAVQGLPARRDRARDGLRPRRGLLRRARHRAAPRPHRGRHEHVAARGRPSTTASGSATTASCWPRAPSRAGWPIPGGELDGVFHLRSIADADALRRRLERGGAVVVVGAGWIGAEVAASARLRGLDVTLVDVTSVPLERVLGPEVGAVYRDVHADHGVRLLMGTGWRPSRAAARSSGCAPATVARSSATSWSSASASQPRTALAARAGLAIDNGILVDELLRTSAPGVFAAGDVANARHPFYGHRLRVEHWANALHQGPAAARTMLGREAADDRLPYFFSDQYDVGMEYAGLRPHLGPRGLPRRPRDARVPRLLARRRPRRGRHERQCLGRQGRHPAPHPRPRPVDDRRLADPGVPLEQLAPVDAGSVA